MTVETIAWVTKFGSCDYLKEVTWYGIGFGFTPRGNESWRSVLEFGLACLIVYNLPKYQINSLQVIQNSLARAVVKVPKIYHVTPILKSLHWLKIDERIEYKLLSLTYKALTTAQPIYLHSLISVQPPCGTHSSSVVTLPRPPTPSSLRITNRSFRYASPHLWNQLPVSFLQPCVKHSADDVTLSNSPPTCSPLSPSITHSLGSISFQDENLPFPRIFSTMVC